MPQVAQQDYIKNVSIVDAENLTDNEKSALLALMERGTIWDAIITVGSWDTRVCAVCLVDKSIVLSYEGATAGQLLLDLK